MKWKRMNRRTRVVAAMAASAVAGAVFAFGANAMASIPDSSGLVHACVSNLTGVVRIIDTAKSGPLGNCIKDGALAETAVSWSQRGPQGGVGPQGPAGPAGPAGATGPAGSPAPAFTSLDQLAGLPCNINSPAAGVVSIAYANDGSGTVTMKCTPTTTFALSVTLTGGAAGQQTAPPSVTSSPAGINCGSTCSASYPVGTPVTLTATPGPDAIFAGWSGPCSGQGVCTVQMNSAQNVTASFTALNSLNLTVLGDGQDCVPLLGCVPAGGAVSVSPGGLLCPATQPVSAPVDCSTTFPAGTVVTLTATPNNPGTSDEESSFAGWGGDCSSAGTATTCALNLDKSKSVTATFKGP